MKSSNKRPPALASLHALQFVFSCDAKHWLLDGIVTVKVITPIKHDLINKSAPQYGMTRLLFPARLVLTVTQPYVEKTSLVRLRTWESEGLCPCFGRLFKCQLRFHQRSPHRSLSWSSGPTETVCCFREQRFTSQAPRPHPHLAQLGFSGLYVWQMSMC